MQVAPIIIKFMLACYTTAEPQEQLGAVHWNSGGGGEARQWLFANGLVDENHRPTKRGKAWVDEVRGRQVNSFVAAFRPAARAPSLATFAVYAKVRRLSSGLREKCTRARKLWTGRHTCSCTTYLSLALRGLCT